MATRKTAKRSIWTWLNPWGAESFRTWCLIYKVRRLCREVDRKMKAVMTPEQYKAYLKAGSERR